MSADQESTRTATRRSILRTAKTVADIEDLRSDWSAWCHDPALDIDAFLAVIRFGNETIRPHVIVLYRDGRPDCLLAGRLVWDHIHLSFGGLNLLLPKARVIRVAGGGFLGNQNVENSGLLVRELLTDLRRGDADAAELNGTRTDSPLYHWATKLPGALCRDHWPPQVLHQSLQLPESFPAFLQSLPRKRRQQFRSRSNYLFKAFPGQVSIKCLHRDISLSDFVKNCEAIASTTYQRRLQTGFINNRQTREVLTACDAKQMLRGYVMHLAGQPAAFIIGLHREKTLYARFMGYDPRYREFSLGSLLLMHCIQDGLSQPGENTGNIDFGPGNHRYKREICNQQHVESSVSIFAPRPKWIGVNLMRSALILTKLAATRVLTNTNLRESSVRLWRRIVITKRALTATH